jgi:uncharacterized protein YegP (UPF0339 family)
MKHPKFIISKARSGQFWFNLTAKNGQVIITSDMYRSKQACKNGIASVIKNAPIAEIVERV